MQMHGKLVDRSSFKTYENSVYWASLVAQSVKDLPAVQETRFDLWVGKFPWRRKWQPTPVFVWKTSWTEEPGGLQSTGSQRVGRD